MKFDGKNVYFIHPLDKYGLTTFPIYNLFDSDFSILSSFSVNWDSLQQDSPYDKSCICGFNGMHLGIFAGKYGGSKWISVDLWSDYNDNKNYNTISHNLGDVTNDTIFDVSFMVSITNNRFYLYIDGELINVQRFFGNIDSIYKTSTFWVGASCLYDNTELHNQHIFSGDITHLSLHNKFLNLEELDRIFTQKNDLESLDMDSLNSVFHSNFSRKTDYKIFDHSLRGNNLALYMYE